jgi:hypothetical protein
LQVFSCAQWAGASAPRRTETGPAASRSYI